jgi:hypothetical protein
MAPLDQANEAAYRRAFDIECLGRSEFNASRNSLCAQKRRRSNRQHLQHTEGMLAWVRSASTSRACHLTRHLLLVGQGDAQIAEAVLVSLAVMSGFKTLTGNTSL